MKKLLLVAALGCIAAVVLFAQAFSSISGTVVDPTGAVIPGAKVVLVSNDTGAQREDTADAQGRYSFLQIQPGDYKLVGRAPGFNDAIVNSIRLQVNSPASVNITFEKIGAVAETVSVTTDAVEVNTTDATIGNAIGTQAITQLPFYARNVAGLLAFQPGVSFISSDATDYRNGSVNGGKSDQANVTLDGVDVNDQQSGYAFTTVLRVTLDSVQEFRTTTTGANADQGRSSGAQIALVTKSGTNNMHGSAYYYQRPDATSANTFFNNSAGVARPYLDIKVSGGSIGGAIVKNRLFYFANFEDRRDNSETNILRTVPSDLLKQGVVQYRSTDGSVKQLAPDAIKTTVDPLHLGPNSASLAMFKLYPKGNDFTVGDGLNTVGYRFTSPQASKQDTYITRFDYNMNSRNVLFWRGQLQNDHQDGIPQFPGDPPQSVSLNNSKGIAAGWTAVIRPEFISSFRYGYTRQGYEDTGIQNASAVTFRNIDSRYALTKGLARIIPVHNINQDFAWTRGSHDVRFGGTIRLIHNRSTNYGRSFHAATTNVSWLLGTGKDLQPSDLDSKFRTAYGDAMMATLGIISQGTANYNYDTAGNISAVGAPVSRNYAGEEYEMYGQDTWKLTRSLTVTYGLRYSLSPPVYEANGQQISTNIPLGDFFNTRGGLADVGKSQAGAGAIQYILANGPNGRPLYPYHKKNFAPRISLAWSPQSDRWRWLTGGPGKTSIRAGWGMFYDEFGQGLMRLFDQSAFGLATTLTNPSSSQTSSTAPRFTGFNDLPSALIRPAPAGGFPQTQPNNFAITNSIDDTLKQPYTMNMNFTIGREFSNGLFIQGSYVGRLSRRSLIQRDLAMPTNLKDPASGMTYFEAARQLALLARANTPTSSVGKIPFWENLWSGAAGGGLTATQAIYEEYSYYAPDYTSALYDIDLACSPSCSNLGSYSIFNHQFSALSAWSSIGGGDYHAMQWTVRKRFSEGLLFDFNYTYGKSIDLASVTQRSGSFSGFVVNSWFPGQRKAVSDYDTTQIWNAFALYELPIGRGRRFGTGMNRIADAIAGGWQLAPSWTQSTELPVSVGNGRNWPTNWNITGFASQVGPVPAPTASKNAPAVAGKAGPNIFADPKAALAAYDFTLPGDTGQRNGIRGDGNFTINLGVTKNWTMPYNEKHRVQFRWETFNLTNAVRFDVNTVTLDLGNTGSFGKYSDTLTRPRQMQFAVRYDF